MLGDLTTLERIFEGRTPLVERLAGLPYDSPAALFARARAVVDTLTMDEKAQVLNAHPRIGEPPEALRRTSQASWREQGGTPGPADLDVMEELGRLNAAYERRFGFRFVVFVNRRSRSALVPVLRERLERSRDQELAAGLEELLAIAQDRLARLTP